MYPVLSYLQFALILMLMMLIDLSTPPPPFKNAAYTCKMNKERPDLFLEASKRKRNWCSAGNTL